MTTPIAFLLSQLEREYYDGASFDSLTERVAEITRAVLALEPNDPFRRVFESNAPQLWGATADNSPLTEEAVRDALSGANAADHLRAWANFWKFLATRRDVA